MRPKFGAVDEDKIDNKSRPKFGVVDEFIIDWLIHKG